MTFPAGDCLARVLFVVPPALPPAIILVLALHPAKIVHFFIDELLVTRGTVLGCLVERFRVGSDMLLRIGANKKVTYSFCPHAFMVFKQVRIRRFNGVVGIPSNIGFYYAVAYDTRNALIGSVSAQRHVSDIFGATEERDGIVTTGTVSCGFGCFFLNHYILHSLKYDIHRCITMGAGLPFGQDLLVAACRAAVL